jgi:hypothetical protein
MPSAFARADDVITRTERKKFGRQATQLLSSRENPPPGTIMWTGGW